MLDFVGGTARRAAGHDDRRKRPRHPQRQHDVHRRRRPLRAGRPAPAPRPGGPLRPAGVRVPSGATGARPLRRGSRAARRDRRVRRPRRRFSHRRPRPRDSRRRRLLGAEQHGHLRAVGYQTYCGLLEEGAVRELRGETAPPAPAAVELHLGLDLRLPESFIPGNDAAPARLPHCRGPHRRRARLLWRGTTSSTNCSSTSASGAVSRLPASSRSGRGATAYESSSTAVTPLARRPACGC